MGAEASAIESGRSRTLSVGSSPGAALFVWGIWTLMLIGGLAFAGKYTTNYPFADELSYIDKPITVEWLWAQHAEHRIPLAKLIWLGLLKATNYGFNICNYLSVIAVGSLAFAMIRVAKKLRGWTSYSDAFFPLALLNLGQFLNFIWWWQVNHILAPLIANGLFMIIVLQDGRLSLKHAIPAGLCLVLLSLAGPGGLPYVLALSPWLGAWAVLRWRSSSDSHERRRCLIAAGLALTAVLLVGLYFVGYRIEPNTAAGQKVDKHIGLKTFLKTTVQISSIGLGPAIKPYWRHAGLGVLALMFIGGALSAVAWFRRPGERVRASGLLLFLGAMGLLFLALGRARAALGEEYVLIGHYLNLSVPAICSAYLISIIYSRPNTNCFIQMCMFTITSILFLPNLDIALQTGRGRSDMGREFERDMQAGMPPFILAERYNDFLHGATDDAEVIASFLRRVRRVDMPQFRRLVPDPSFREVPLADAPAVCNVRWEDGMGYSCGKPEGAFLEYSLGQPRFVYAIRLKCSYGEAQSSGRALLQLSWRRSDREDYPDEIAVDKRGSALSVDVSPQIGGWFRHESEKTLTIWVNSTIDQFRIYPDNRPFSFKLSGIEILVPSSAQGGSPSVQRKPSVSDVGARFSRSAVKNGRGRIE